MKIYQDKRIVMTLDAGGTNFVFSAIREGKEVVDPVTVQANVHDLRECLDSIIHGFNKVKSELEETPSAISFAFPGPADYRAGIIGDLPNLPCFRGGMPLGPMLEEYFKMPVFISNDGDLFTFGEAAAGLLPEINRQLEMRGIPKAYRNLFGITLGTGFGGGIVVNNSLCTGDNSAAGEIWLMRNFKNTRLIAEEGVSVRAIQRVYSERSGASGADLSPKDIYDIAAGKKAGNQEAARASFEEMAAVIGESLANSITLIDGMIVIGGGLAGASKFLLSGIVDHLNGTIENMRGDKIPRLVSRAYNLEEQDSFESFFKFRKTRLAVPYSDKSVEYVPEKRIGVGLSRLGASRAISLGAYAVAVDRL